MSDSPRHHVTLNNSSPCFLSVLMCVYWGNGVTLFNYFYLARHYMYPFIIFLFKSLFSNTRNVPKFNLRPAPHPPEGRQPWAQFFVTAENTLRGLQYS